MGRATFARVHKCCFAMSTSPLLGPHRAPCDPQSGIQLVLLRASCLELHLNPSMTSWHCFGEVCPLGSDLPFDRHGGWTSSIKTVCCASLVIPDVANIDSARLVSYELSQMSLLSGQQTRAVAHVISSDSGPSRRLRISGHSLRTPGMGILSTFTCIFMTGTSPINNLILESVKLYSDPISTGEAPQRGFSGRLLAWPSCYHTILSDDIDVKE